MALFQLIEQSKGNYLVEGDITFASVNKIKSFGFLNTAKEINIDLEKVNLADSAGLSLIIEWIKQSKHYNTKLKFKNVPRQLLTLAKLCDFDINDYLLLQQNQ